LQKPTKSISVTSSKQESIKLLDSKRSQSIGILITSKRLDSQLIRDALINFDNKLLSYETLNAIYAIRPQEDELRLIQDYLKATPNSEEALDKPETFLLELSRIPAFEERIYCLVYKNKFHESISSIEFRLSSMGTICDDLLANMKIKKILGIILACGNNMNATNKTRGDADGFDLAILPNLKDVKSKDNSTNLLQYIAYYYVSKIDDDLNKYPLSDPSDYSFVAQVNFEELDKELRKVRNELKDIEQRAETVNKTTQSEEATKKSDSNDESFNATLEPFKARITDFLKQANEECKEQEENLIKIKAKFQKMAISFGVKPRTSENEVTTDYFFTLWSNFSQDLKDAWKREVQKLTKLK
jgi:hypothetical protein